MLIVLEHDGHLWKRICIGLMILSLTFSSGIKAQDSIVRTQQDACCSGLSDCFFLPQGPVALTSLAFGTSTLFWDEAQRHNLFFQEQVQLWRRDNMDNVFLHFDNVTQYLPATSMVALKLVGVPSKHGLWEIVRNEAVCYLSLAACVLPVKYGLALLRPDRSGYNSFPSGHTAISFAGAEMLRLEYGQTSVLIPIAGYTVAALTGFLRVYNNCHWTGDVLAGIGIGILLADFSYWLNDRLFDRRKEAMRECGNVGIWECVNL